MLIFLWGGYYTSEKHGAAIYIETSYISITGYVATTANSIINNFFFTDLLRNKWQLKLCIFEVYVVIWYTCTWWNDYHNVTN